MSKYIEERLTLGLIKIHVRTAFYHIIYRFVQKNVCSINNMIKYIEEKRYGIKKEIQVIRTVRKI